MTPHDTAISETIPDLDDLQLQLLKMLAPVHPKGIPLWLALDRRIARRLAKRGLCEIMETHNLFVVIITRRGLEMVRDEL